MKFVLWVICSSIVMGAATMAQEKEIQTVVTLPQPNFQMPTIEESIKLAEQGDVLSQLTVGSAYQKGAGVPKNIEQAIKWFTKAADQGLDLAMISLGTIYQSGEGVEKDYDQAFNWYKKAADQNSSFGGTILGIAYLEGEIVEQDYDLAHDYLIEAAKNYGFLAHLYLGIMEMEGHGRDKDPVKAFMWFELACAGLDVGEGYETAEKLQTELRSQLTQEQIDEAKNMANDWADKNG